MSIIFDIPSAKLAVFIGAKIVDQMVFALSEVQPETEADAVSALLSRGFAPIAVDRLGPLAMQFADVRSHSPATGWSASAISGGKA